MSSGYANKCWFVSTRPLSSMMKPEPLPPRGLGCGYGHHSDGNGKRSKNGNDGVPRRLVSVLSVFDFDKYDSRPDRVDDVGDRVWTARNERVHHFSAPDLLRTGNVSAKTNPAAATTKHKSTSAALERRRAPVCIDTSSPLPESCTLLFYT